MNKKWKRQILQNTGRLCHSRTWGTVSCVQVNDTVANRLCFVNHNTWATAEYSLWVSHSQGKSIQDDLSRRIIWHWRRLKTKISSPTLWDRWWRWSPRDMSSRWWSATTLHSINSSHRLRGRLSMNWWTGEPVPLSSVEGELLLLHLKIEPVSESNLISWEHSVSVDEWDTVSITDASFAHVHQETLSLTSRMKLARSEKYLLMSSNSDIVLSLCIFLFNWVTRKGRIVTHTQIAQLLYLLWLSFASWTAIKIINEGERVCVCVCVNVMLSRGQQTVDDWERASGTVLSSCGEKVDTVHETHFEVSRLICRSQWCVNHFHRAILWWK